jgi:hypothetical protein
VALTEMDNREEACRVTGENDITAGRRNNIPAHLAGNIAMMTLATIA